MDNEVQTPVVLASDKPEIAPRPSFLKDVRNGLVHVAKVAWQVPAARGYIATLLVRYGVPTALAAVVTLVVDGLLK